MIVLKKSREQILNEISANAAAAVQSQLHSNLGNQLRVETGSLTYALQQAIADAVTAGFEVLLQNQYTDDDFERDMTLKP